MGELGRRGGGGSERGRRSGRGSGRGSASGSGRGRESRRGEESGRGNERARESRKSFCPPLDQKGGKGATHRSPADPHYERNLSTEELASPCPEKECHVRYAEGTPISHLPRRHRVHMCR